MNPAESAPAVRDAARSPAPHRRRGRKDAADARLPPLVLERLVAFLAFLLLLLGTVAWARSDQAEAGDAPAPAGPCLMPCPASFGAVRDEARDASDDEEDDEDEGQEKDRDGRKDKAKAKEEKRKREGGKGRRG